MTWYDFIVEEAKKPYYAPLYNFIQEEYKKGIVYPPYDKIYNFMNLVNFDDIKCVIVGQDPYHEPGQAMGLSFSVPEGVTIPPSLMNIYKEIRTEYGVCNHVSGDLTCWAQQGVLLINAVLTVRAHQAGSHAGHGWETFTDDILKELNNQDRPIVYMLWGRYARNKAGLITNKRALVLESAHPSPFSADKGFFGNGHFKKCNDYLEKNGLTKIKW